MVNEDNSTKKIYKYLERKCVKDTYRDTDHPPLLCDKEKFFKLSREGYKLNAEIQQLV